MAQTWKDEEKVHEYVARVGRLQARAEGERELIQALPAGRASMWISRVIVAMT